MEAKKIHLEKSALNQLVEARRTSVENRYGIGFQFEPMGLINGCSIINDSKSTTAETTLYSLDMIKSPVHLILGNTNAEEILTYLGNEIKLKVVTIGFYKEIGMQEMEAVLKLADRTLLRTKLDELVTEMLSWTKSGETLLFSPASQDRALYENYVQRGMHFNKIVEPLLRK